MSDNSLKNVNRIGISQYHNTIPFYKGDFQYLENNLNKLSHLKDDYEDYYIDDPQYTSDFVFKTKQKDKKDKYG